MIPQPIQMSVLDSLVRRPSRASAAAIGHEFVLNGAQPNLRHLGLDALDKMVCDWSVAILEETIDEPTRGFHLRQHAVTKLRDLVKVAIDRGYSAINSTACHQLARAAQAELRSQVVKGQVWEIRAVEDLCDHLSQAVADGFFGELPDF